jgi:hypothetical protein
MDRLKEELLRMEDRMGKGFTSLEGKMDAMAKTLGESSTVSAVLTERLAGMERERVAMWDRINAQEEKIMELNKTISGAGWGILWKLIGALAGGGAIGAAGMGAFK